MILTVLWWFAIGAVGLGLAQKLTGLVLADPLLRSRADGTSWSEAPSVSLICPVRGAEKGLEKRLRRFCRQDYDGPLEVLICAEEPSDPALAAARRVANDYDCARALVSEEIGAPGLGKGKNMIAGTREGSGEVLLFVDSDVEVEPEMAARVAPAALGTGLAFRVPVCTGAENLVAALQAFTINEAVLAIAPQWQGEGEKTAFGSTMALRRHVFEEVGGEKAIARAAADDTALSRAVREAGHGLHLLPRPARLVHRRDRVARWLRHQLRWMVILRRYSPTGTAALLPLLHSSFWALLALGTGALQGGGLFLSSVLAVGTAGVEIGAQAWVTLSLAGASELRKYLWAVPLADLPRPPLWATSWTTNWIWWRGRWLYVDSDGTLLQEK